MAGFACGVCGHAHKISHKSKGRCRVLDNVDENSRKIDLLIMPEAVHNFKEPQYVFRTTANNSEL